MEICFALLRIKCYVEPIVFFPKVAAPKLHQMSGSNMKCKENTTHGQFNNIVSILFNIEMISLCSAVLQTVHTGQ